MQKIFQVFIGGIAGLFRIFSEQQLSKSWWVRVQTESPDYTYYFGPFERRAIAHQRLPGYVEDLQMERARVSRSSVEWCNPPELTIEGVHQPV
jgi:hypothetical protein